MAAELNTTAEDAAAQLKQGVFLTPEQLTSSQWLGKDGAPGGVASNLHDAAGFLAQLKKIPSAPSPDVFTKAVYTSGLGSGQ